MIRCLAICVVGMCLPGAALSAPPASYQHRDGWSDSMLATREAVLAGARAAVPLWPQFERDFPVESDWMTQDLQAVGFSCAQIPNQLKSYPARWFTPQVDPDI